VGSREIDNIRRSHIQVPMQRVSGILESTKYNATADIDFKIDLLNESGLQQSTALPMKGKHERMLERKAIWSQ
jgi:hypothetical protein